jgi:hypothetical protein
MYKKIAVISRSGFWNVQGSPWAENQWFRSLRLRRGKSNCVGENVLKKRNHYLHIRRLGNVRRKL